MFRVVLLLALLGVTHCVVWGFHHHGSWPDSDSGPDSSGSGPNFSGSGPNSSGSGPDSNCSPSEENKQPATWHSEHDKRFKKLSDYVIRADRYSKNICERYTPSNVQESHVNSMYTLTYPMPQVDPANITVKIKHRVLYMYARQSESQDSPTYVDVRILPDSLKLSEATWTYSEDQLIIGIPDDIALKVRKVKTCSDVNKDVKDVRQTSPIIYKFGQ